MSAAPAIAETEVRKGLGPSQYERCKHAGCSDESRLSFAGGYCLKHYLTHKDEVMAKTTFPDDQVRAAWESTKSVNAVAAALKCSWQTARHNLERLGLGEASGPRPKKRRAGSKKTGLGPAAADLLAPEAKAAGAIPPPRSGYRSRAVHQHGAGSAAAWSAPGQRWRARPGRGGAQRRPADRRSPAPAGGRCAAPGADAGGWGRGGVAGAGGGVRGC